MTTEYGDAASKTSETNPLRISNLFHLTLGAFNVLGGGVMAFLLTREAQIRGLGLIPALAIAASLLVLGLTQIARAWRDEKFRFHPDDIGDFAAPEKFSRDGKPDQAGYLIATELTAALGLRGFRLHLAVEGATGFDSLAALAPKIREAVGADKYARLEQALFA